MSKPWQVARRLLYQNRWLYLLLMLWPVGLAVLFLLPASSPDRGDVLLILHQECLYGLALVVFSGSVQLGNEQRSRRIVGVLSRSVSRREYLLALLCSAWLPLVPYTASLVLGTVLLTAQMHHSFAGIVAMALTLLFLGLWTAAVSLFFAVWLPSFLASTATLALISGIALLGEAWSGFGPGRMFGALLGMGPGAGLLMDAGYLWRGWDWLAVSVCAVFFFAAAAAIFERRDLRLKGD